MLGHLGMISLLKKKKTWFQGSGEQWGRYNLPREIHINPYKTI